MVLSAMGVPIFSFSAADLMPPGVLTDKKTSSKRNSIFFTCFYYLAPHFKNDDSSLSLGCRARKVFVEKLTSSKIKENFPVFVREKEKKGYKFVNVAAVNLSLYEI